MTIAEHYLTANEIDEIKRQIEGDSAGVWKHGRTCANGQHVDDCERTYFFSLPSRVVAVGASRATHGAWKVKWIEVYELAASGHDGDKEIQAAIQAKG